MLQNNLAALANTTLFGIERLQRLQGSCLPGLKGIESGKKPHNKRPLFLPWLGKVIKWYMFMAVCRTIRYSMIMYDIVISCLPRYVRLIRTIVDR